MTPAVLLLLSILTVQGSGCDDTKTAVTNLQDTIKSEHEIGFSEVFPNNYYVSHYFNSSILCNEPCCVFSAAVLLSDSWTRLLQHLSRVHLKRDLIVELKITLDAISKGKFNERPDLSAFPTIQSSPKDLLSFTASLFSTWLDLDCDREHQCVFPTPSQEDDQYDSAPEENEDVENSKPVDEEQFEVEGEKGKRWVTPTDGYTKSYSPGLSLWTSSFLWIAPLVTLSLIF